MPEPVTHPAQPSIRDVADRLVRIGDTVGGLTTACPRGITVTGTVTAITNVSVKITVQTVIKPVQRKTTLSRLPVPAIGEEIGLLRRMMFLISSPAGETARQRPLLDHVTAVQWSGKVEDLPSVQRFTGPALVGAVVVDGGLALLIHRTGTENPDTVPPGWYVVRRPTGRYSAIDANAYRTNYAPAV